MGSVLLVLCLCLCFCFSFIDIRDISLFLSGCACVIFTIASQLQSSIVNQSAWYDSVLDLAFRLGEDPASKSFWNDSNLVQTGPR